MSDVEGALDALSKEVGHDRKADLQLARAYFSVAMVRGNAVSDGSMGDLDSGLRYTERSAEVAGGIIRHYPGDSDAQKMFLSAQMGILYIYRRREQFAEAEKIAREIISHARALPSAMHREGFFVDYDIATAYKEIAAIKTSRGHMEEALDLNRAALSALNANMQENWLKLPLIKNNLSACDADTGLSEWRLHGYSESASALVHRGLELSKGCPEVMCKSRAAELEGYAGLVDWSGGREEEGLELLKRGIADIEALSAADSADVIFKSVAESLRRSYALALVASHRPQEALDVLGKYFKPGDPQAEAEDLLVYGQVVDANSGRESGERYYLAARERLDKQRKSGFEPQVMRWAVSHALADRANRSKQYEAAIGQRREELRLAGQLEADAYTAKLFTSVTAAAFARTVAAMTNAPAGLRAEALQQLNACCDGVPRLYRVEHAGMIVATPSDEVLSKLKAALASREQ
jgi:hypothetical protein